MSNHSIPIQYDEPGAALGGAPLFNFVYCSQVREGVGSADVDNIIAASRRRNRAQRITGLLVFGSGVFFQWIEGPKAEVMSLVKLIETDVRHEMMVTLSTDEEIRERIFPLGIWSLSMLRTFKRCFRMPFKQRKIREALMPCSFCLITYRRAPSRKLSGVAWAS